MRLTCAARGHRLPVQLVAVPRHPIRKHDARQANTPPVYGHAACCRAPKSRLLEIGRRSKRRRPQQLCVCTFGPCCAGATRFAGPAQRLRFRSSASRPRLLMAVGSRLLAHELKRWASQCFDPLGWTRLHKHRSRAEACRAARQGATGRTRDQGLSPSLTSWEQLSAISIPPVFVDSPVAKASCWCSASMAKSDKRRIACRAHSGSSGVDQ